MSETLNPYRQWLGLDIESHCANHYQLLGLAEGEDDSAKIRAAADRALARVRSHRPGPHAARWAQLLDELAEAKASLDDPESKAEYDAALRAGTTSPDAMNAADEGPEVAEPAGDAAEGSEQRYPPTGRPGAHKMSVSETSERRAKAPETRREKPLPNRSGERAAASNTREKQTGDRRARYSAKGPQSKPQARGKGKPGASPSSATLSDSSPTQPINAHVAPPPQESSANLLIIVSVAAVLVVITLFIMFLALRDSLSGGAAPRDSSAFSKESSSPTVGLSGSPEPGRDDAGGERLLAERAGAKRSAATTRPKGNSKRVSEDGPHATDSGEMFGDKSAKAGKSAANDRPRNPENPLRGSSDSGVSSRHSSIEEPKTVNGSSERGAARASSVKAAESQELNELLEAVVTDLGGHRFTAAQEKLATAAELATRPADRKRVAGWEEVADYSQQFWRVVTAACASFRGAEELHFPENDLVVLVVESGPEEITVRKSGRNLRYSVKEIPPGLAIAIAKTQLDTNRPESLLQLGSFLAAQANRKPRYLEEARKYWERAAAAGGDVSALLTTLPDSSQVTPSR